MVKIINIDEDIDANTAWYYCSNGRTYFDPMYTGDTFEGDYIDPEAYQEC